MHLNIGAYTCNTACITGIGEVGVHINIGSDDVIIAQGPLYRGNGVFYRNNKRLFDLLSVNKLPEVDFSQIIQ